jgi:cardiolipin synthase
MRYDLGRQQSKEYRMVANNLNRHKANFEASATHTEAEIIPWPLSKSSTRIYTFANVITTLRILIVPFIAYGLFNGHFLSATLCFFAAAASDGLDGLIARTLSIRSKLGAILDPLADKLLLMTVFTYFALSQELPLVLAIAIITRDALIMVSVAYFMHKGSVRKMNPTLVSKINTCVELILASLILCRLSNIFALEILEESFYGIVAMTLFLSTISYFQIAHTLHKTPSQDSL